MLLLSSPRQNIQLSRPRFGYSVNCLGLEYVVYYSYKVDRPHSNENDCSSENGAYRQGKYIKFICKKEGEREMTKKEKQVFQEYRDSANSELARAYKSGDSTAIDRALDWSVRLTCLFDDLFDINEQGA
jgi:hypothetical protein